MHRSGAGAALRLPQPTSAAAADRWSSLAGGDENRTAQLARHNHLVMNRARWYSSTASAEVGQSHHSALAIVKTADAVWNDPAAHPGLVQEVRQLLPKLTEAHRSAVDRSRAEGEPAQVQPLRQPQWVGHAIDPRIHLSQKGGASAARLMLHEVEADRASVPGITQPV